GGTLDIAGSPAPMPVYTLQGLVGRYAGVAGRSPRAQSPFVGRERELALLHDRLAAVRAGQGQVVGLVGESGRASRGSCTNSAAVWPDRRSPCMSGSASRTVR